MKRLQLSFAALLLATAAAANPPALPAFPPLRFKPPQGLRVALPNGMLLYLLENHELPLIEGDVMVQTGKVLDPADKIGLAGLLGRSLRAGGTKHYKADQINETLEFLGASIETGMGLEDGSGGFSCLSKDFDQVLPILADILINPAFEPDKVEVERGKILEDIRRRNDEPDDIARRESRRMLYGPDNPYGWREELKTVQAVSRGDLERFHKRFYRPAAVSIAVEGDFDSLEMVEKFKKAFSEWKPGSLDLPKWPEVRTPAGRAVVLIPKEVTQAAMRFVQLGLERHDPDHFKYEVMNDILGGMPFSSRLFTQVRSRKGLAYYAGSYFTEWRVPGMIGAACGTKNETAHKAAEEVLYQLQQMRSEPVREEELRQAVDSIVNSFIFNYETSFEIISQRMSLDYFGFPADYLDTYLDKIQAVTPTEVREVAVRRLRPEQMILLVIGDPKKFDHPLDSFGQVIVKEAD